MEANHNALTRAQRFWAHNIMPKVTFIAERGQLGESNSRIVLSGVKVRKHIPVPLRINWKGEPIAQIGFHNVAIDAEAIRITADIPEEHLDLFPAIGVTYSNTRQTRMVRGVHVIESCRLFEVSLNSAPNADTGIKSIREQLEDQKSETVREAFQ